MGQKIKNNARALLFGSISALDTSLTVEAAKADTFPVATTTNWLTPLDWYNATIQDNSGNIEIVKVGVRNSGSGVMSVLQRGQQGTTPRAFAAGSVVELRITAEDVEAAIAAPVALLAALTPLLAPVGGIILYDGVLGDLPGQWVVCDGNNGTPNMTDKFVIGAGPTYAKGTTGGSKDAVVVSHTHTAAFTGDALGAHGHAINDPGHSHTLPGVYDTYGAFPNVSAVLVQSGSINTSHVGTGVTVAGASAGTPTGTVAVNSAGVSGTDKNLPPYYALYYIKRIA